RVAGERSELAEHGGLLDEIDTQRKVGARSEQRPSGLVELVLLRVVLQGGIVERLAILQHSAEHFDAPIAVEWPDAKHRPAGDSARGDREVAVDVAGERRIIEDVLERAVEELR